MRDAYTSEKLTRLMLVKYWSLNIQNMGLAHARESYAILIDTPASYSLIFQTGRTAKHKYKCFSVHLGFSILWDYTTCTELKTQTFLNF